MGTMLELGVAKRAQDKVDWFERHSVCIVTNRSSYAHAIQLHAAALPHRRRRRRMNKELIKGGLDSQKSKGKPYSRIRIRQTL